MKVCWCGSVDLLPFNAHYSKCASCGTLVSQQSLTDEQLVVRDDETDFYGKQYWLGHQAQDLGFPDIHARARRDLTERNLHWLRILLKYRLPPAKTLELGCAHGSFVAMMEKAGFASSGVEMSPWVVEFGKKTFGIDIQTGPIEDLEIAPGSLDVIALMDVLEHLPDPAETMRHCLALLKPDGLLLIQTPKFDSAMKYPELVAEQGPFLEQLKADEHLYLFTEDSVTRLFSELGAPHVAFEPAIFAMYDMFLAVSRMPLSTHSDAQIESALLDTPSRRFVLALLDMGDREAALIERATASDVDRTARGEQVVALTEMLRESEADRDARGQQIEALGARLSEADADRTARGEQVVALAALLRESEADRDARGREIDALGARLSEADADRTARGEQLVALTTLLRESEADRDARGREIDALGARLIEADADRTARGEQVVVLTAMLRESEADRDARAQQIDALSAMLKEADADRTGRGEQVVTLTALLHQSEKERETRAQQIDALNAMVIEADTDRTARGAQITAVTAMLRESEADRQARVQQIEAVNAMVIEVDADRTARGAQVVALTAMLRESEEDRAARADQLGAWNRLMADVERDKVARDDEVRVLNSLLRDAETERAALKERAAVLDEELARCVARIGTLSSAAAQRAKEIAEEHADLRRLLSKREFLLCARVMRWPEVEKLKVALNSDSG